MKIKRFEAPTMSEALRRIKKEFGDDAVILSAKSQKRNKSFLGKKAAEQVVVTAAIDKEQDAVTTGASATQPDDGKTPIENGARPDDGNTLSASSILKRFNPITKTGQKILKPKIVELMNAPKPEPPRSPLYQRLVDKGLESMMAADWDRQIADLLPGDATAHTKDAVQAISQVIKAMQLVGTRHRHQSEQQKCIIMVGPSGAGKTSAVAKMATKLAMQHPDSVAVLSLDNQRAAGPAELERFAPIIGIPFKKAFKVDQITSALSSWQGLSHIIVDTPAVSLNDPLQREKLLRRLTIFNNAEHLMVINAATQEKTMVRMIHYFMPLTIHAFCFTGLDWCVDPGPLINQSNAHQRPIEFISDSASISEALKPATANLLAELLIGEISATESVGPESVTVVARSKQLPDHYYVANRNSDIFHFHECKSVKRIHTDNMIIFKDSAEAMGRQFKPCRMCCSELIVPQPFDRLARGYASSRY
ncbi:MAG: Ada metal-binding domain-containing protein [Desulfobacteraceae bacterium]